MSLKHLLVGLLFIGSASAAEPLPAFIGQDGTDAWTEHWRDAYGCRIERNGTTKGRRCLGQHMAEGYPKGNHAWSVRGVPVDAGRTYEFSCAVKYEDVREAMIEVYYFYADGGQISRSHAAKFSGTTNDWQQVCVRFLPPAGTDKMNIALRLNSTGHIWWDKPKLEPVGSSLADVKFCQAEQRYSLKESVGIVRLYDHQKIQDLNIKWVRYNAPWGRLERRQKGEWDQTAVDEIVRNCRKAREKGMHVMLSLGYPPYWAARELKGVKNGCHVPRDIAEWTNYVHKITGWTRDYVDAYRIMNEPDHQWDSGAKPEEYTTFLKTGGEAVRLAAPGKLVVMAGLSGAPCGFLQAMYEHGAKGNMDIAACQPYVIGQTSPEKGHQADRLKVYRMVMAANNDNSPLWLTEFGYTCQPVSHLTQQQQAAYAVRAHVIALASGAGVAKTFYYLLQDGEGDGCSRTGGMYDREWCIKPIGKAVRTLAGLFNPIEKHLGRVELGPGITAELFAVSGTEHVLVCWIEDETRMLKVKIPGVKNGRIFSIYGDAADLTPEAELNVGFEPVYLQGDLTPLLRICTAPPPIDYKSIAKAESLAQPVAWKAVMTDSPEWQTIPELPLVDRSNGEKRIGGVRLIGTPGGLYVRGRISDDTPACNRIGGFAQIWSQDCLELFINRSPEQTPAGFVTKECLQLIVSPGDAKNPGAFPPAVYLAAEGGVGSGKKFMIPVQVTVDAENTGYEMNVLIPWKALGLSGLSETTIGFDALATVSDGTGKRTRRGAWSGNEGNASDASLWGRIVFKTSGF